MTDYEKMKALLTEFGVQFTELTIDRGPLIFTEQGGLKVGGYLSFYTIFEFDSTGAFVEMGAYE